MSTITTISLIDQRQPLDFFIDQVTQSVERAELRAGIKHDKDREQLETIGPCECSLCMEETPCPEEPDVLVLADAGVKVVCGYCHDRHPEAGVGTGLMLYKMPDSELAEWGRVR